MYCDEIGNSKLNINVLWCMSTVQRCVALKLRAEILRSRFPKRSLGSFNHFYRFTPFIPHIVKLTTGKSVQGGERRRKRERTPRHSDGHSQSHSQKEHHIKKEHAHSHSRPHSHHSRSHPHSHPRSHPHSHPQSERSYQHSQRSRKKSIPTPPNGPYKRSIQYDYSMNL